MPCQPNPTALQLEAELKRAAAGRATAPDFWTPMGPNVRQSFHLLWRSASAASAGACSGFVPNSQLLWELTRPYCGLSRFDCIAEHPESQTMGRALYRGSTDGGLVMPPLGSKC